MRSAGGTSGWPDGGARRPRRPAFLDPAAADALPGGGDPALRDELAHTTAAALVLRGRASTDPHVIARLVALVETEGLDTVAELWALSPATTLPGALWRLYALADWVRRDPQVVADRYRQGVAAAPVHDVVAGVAATPGPDDVRELTRAVLAGVYTRELDVALERASAFCRVLATGAAFDAEHLDHPGGAALVAHAAGLVRTADELAQAARLWRQGQLD